MDRKSVCQRLKSEPQSRRQSSTPAHLKSKGPQKAKALVAEEFPLRWRRFDASAVLYTFSQRDKRGWDLQDVSEGNEGSE